jgi:CheY-like chemotaxis protein
MQDYRILVVEDEQPAAKIISFYLEKESSTIIYAPDGPFGEKLLLQQQPHLVVLDVMLPGFDGLELCRRIRRQFIVPILMLTARANVKPGRQFQRQPGPQLQLECCLTHAGTKARPEPALTSSSQRG